MEPIDDILLPPEPAKGPRRLRSRHILRALAALLILAALLYADKVLKMDIAATPGQRTADFLGIVPVFLFGVILWWYAGRNVDELARPLFRGQADKAADVRLGWGNGVWVLASLFAGFIGLCALTFGATLALRGDALKKAYPALEQELEQFGLHGQKMTKFFSVLSDLNLSPQPILIMGGLLVLLAGVALVLALRRRAPQG